MAKVLPELNWQIVPGERHIKEKIVLLLNVLYDSDLLKVVA